MPITLNGDSGITTPTYGGAVAAEYIAPVTAFKNRIINGAMQIDQRNNGASVTVPAPLFYTLDRWQAQSEQANKYSVEQTITGVSAPVGFTDYLGATSLTAHSIVASDRFIIRQAIEGFNVADLGFGTANAKTITISFWVRSSLTGNFGGYIGNSALNRSYPFSYTISDANTWEQKSITIAGDTSGTWLTNNDVGLRIGFSLGAGSTYTGTGNAWASSQILAPTGSTSVVGTNGATFYITGVQLEKGSTATSFDYRPYGTELALCQRYYEESLFYIRDNGVTSGLYVGNNVNFSTTKRAVPTVAVKTVISTSNVTVAAPLYTTVNGIGFGISATATGTVDYAATLSASIEI
jgi:hypothetical protein